MERDHDAAIKCVKNWFIARGHAVLMPKNKHANGPDLTVIAKDQTEVWKVEVKTIKKKKLGQYSVEPISLDRQRDDFLFIANGDTIFWYGTMEDHIKCCSSKGFRAMTPLFKIWSLK